MIAASRFIASSDYPDEWHAARAASVSATTVSKCATASGMADYWAGLEIPFVDNEYMAYGRDSEPIFHRWAKREHGLFENRWLIAHESRPDWTATVDGLSLDHTEIAEYKTTGDPWDGAEQNLAKIPIQYRRQVAWQLLVSGAGRALFGWLWRVRADDGSFYTPWLEPRSRWITRAEIESLLPDLIDTAERLMTLRENHARDTQDTF